MAKKNKEQPKKEKSLMGDFNLVSFVVGSFASYILMFPVETFGDAARTLFMHSTAGESFVNAATDMFGWLMPEIANIYSPLTAPYEAAVNASFSGAQVPFAPNTPVSMDTVSDAGDMLNASDMLFN